MQTVGGVLPLPRGSKHKGPLVVLWTDSAKRWPEVGGKVRSRKALRVKKAISPSTIPLEISVEAAERVLVPFASGSEHRGS